jgi:hypothetical protein
MLPTLSAPYLKREEVARKEIRGGCQLLPTGESSSSSDPIYLLGKWTINGHLGHLNP